MINVIAKRNSPRFSYTLDLIFGDMMKVPYSISEEVKDDCINLRYGKDGDLPDSGLLWENNVSAQPLVKETGEWHGEPVFFAIPGAEIPFDLFSATFYLVSRYEENLPYPPDDHGRFPAEQSILVQNNWILKPLVNIWVFQLHQWMKSRFPGFSASLPEFRFISTIDVDMAWKFRNKGLFRQSGGIVHDILTFNISQIKDKIRVWNGKSVDPFDNFSWQHKIHRERNTDVRYFVQIGKNGKHDKNISPLNLEFRQLIRNLDIHGEVGIHPSYQSFNHPGAVEREINDLANILGRPVRINRQHFLRMTLPETYKVLLKNGIEEDYTLGYTSHRGFRAGIAFPFYWFDLTNNSSTRLKLYPFCMMDVTPMHYEKKNVELAIGELDSWMKYLSNYGCLFISLWHNESLSNTGRWDGWLPLYEKMIASAAEIQKALNQ